MSLCDDESELASEHDSRLNGAESDEGGQSIVALFHHFTALRRAERQRMRDQDGRYNPPRVVVKPTMKSELDRVIDEQRRDIKRKVSLGNFESCLAPDGSIQPGCMPSIIRHISASQTLSQRLQALRALEKSAAEPQRIARFVELGGLPVLRQWLESRVTSHELADKAALEDVWCLTLRLLKLLSLPLATIKSSGLLATCCEACFLPHAESSRLAAALVSAWQTSEVATLKTVVVIEV